MSIMCMQCLRMIGEGIRVPGTEVTLSSGFPEVLGTVLNLLEEQAVSAPTQVCSF